jgi:homeobox-leucine zipper protein
MELGLSLGDAMADAGRELVLGLGVGGAGSAGREERGRRDLEVAAGAMRCGSSPEPSMRLALLPMAPALGFPWPSDSSESCMPLLFPILGFLACLGRSPKK